tara:strand:- start:769 stop:2049 length:1281 start_codon:yes stop_codon:yes gene_type:complete
MIKKSDKSIGIIGLGYVGLPLAIEFGKIKNTTGYDINANKVQLLQSYNDQTGQINRLEFKKSRYLKITNKISELKKCDIYIVTVPTPVDANNIPDLSFLTQATKSVGSILSKNNIVIFESTVYPGTTEEICVPILEDSSNLKYNKDFFCGYSPERVNPGDNKHTLTNITKIVSGSTKNISSLIYDLYAEIIKAGIFEAKSIKVAESAKIIENAQRDINIAFINELSMIFSKLKIDTHDVLEAASTKWNFLNFKPGLVGGHCIGVDPYYLAFKAKEIGVEPEIILSGRKINNYMSNFITEQICENLKLRKINLDKSKALLMGLTFKENCLDLRNSKSKDTFMLLKNKGLLVDIHDPLALEKDIEQEYGQKNIDLKTNSKKYNVIILAVSHQYYKHIKIENLKKHLKKEGFVFDVKGILPRNNIVIRL